MNKDLMFSSKTDLWETPQDLFDQLNNEFHFNLDVCALPENAKCAAYYSPEINGLAQPWYGTCWCNPPYGKQRGVKMMDDVRLAMLGVKAAQERLTERGELLPCPCCGGISKQADCALPSRRR